MPRNDTHLWGWGRDQEYDAHAQKMSANCQISCARRRTTFLHGEKISSFFATMLKKCLIFLLRKVCIKIYGTEEIIHIFDSIMCLEHLIF